MEKNFHSNGKLLLTGEFLVIDGAKALALPCLYGQTMKVTPIDEQEIIWESYTDEGKLWYEGIFAIQDNGIENVPYAFQRGKPNETSERLTQILNVLLELNPIFFKKGGFLIETRLEFPKSWGLGSSSTLLANMAKWAGVNPYVLSNKTFGGSAYDIACADNESPLVYQRTDGVSPQVELVDFNPSFKHQLFFVHLNQKQNTREVVARYKALNSGSKKAWIEEISELTENFLNCQRMSEFDELIWIHENIIAEALAMPPIKQELFPGYPRAIKSLGAWGGDFVLATGGVAERQYFEDKGYTTIVEYDNMVL